MKKLRILLTGDDGYNAMGIRVLVHYLKAIADLVIIATRDQMSGVGGHLSLKNGGTWEKTSVEGVPAIWVSGYPCDAMEFAVGLYDKPFDLIISGINMGMNIGGALVTSGTYSAGIRGLNLKLAPKALVLSWHSPPSMWQKRHSDGDDIKALLKYPGKTAASLVFLAHNKNYWGANLLNINFPQQESRTIRFTRGLPDLRKFFSYPINRNHKTKKFSYPKIDKQIIHTKINDISTDTGAMLEGYISISPHKEHNLDDKVYEATKNKEIII